MDRRRSDTRERILDEALRLFAEHGSAATSMRAIGDAVGIRGPSLYAHFESKQAIVNEMVTRAGPLSLLEVMPDAEATDDDDPAGFLLTFVDRIVRCWTATRARQAYALLVTESLRGTLPEERSLERMIAPVLEAVGARLERFIERGTMRDDLSGEDLAWELIAPIANLRISYWTPRATRSQLARGRALARKHASYFVDRNVLTDHL